MPERTTSLTVNSILCESASYIRSHAKEIFRALTIPIIVSIILIALYDSTISPNVSFNFAGEIFSTESDNQTSGTQEAAGSGIKDFLSNTVVANFIHYLFYIYISTVIILPIILLYFKTGSKLKFTQQYIISRQQFSFFLRTSVVEIAHLIIASTIGIIFTVPIIMSSKWQSVTYNIFGITISSEMILFIIVSIITTVIYSFIKSLSVKWLITSINIDIPDDYIERQVRSKFHLRMFLTLTVCIFGYYLILLILGFLTDSTTVGSIIFNISSILAAFLAFLVSAIASCIAFQRSVLDQPPEIPEY